ncbi:hypothetical protein K439DRAFT_1665754 [Ramaria rubella]|nr:hypothetical protein K439DRAFT_1665754 [Ramaria rubella]
MASVVVNRISKPTSICCLIRPPNINQNPCKKARNNARLPRHDSAFCVLPVVRDFSTSSCLYYARQPRRRPRLFHYENPVEQSKSEAPMNALTESQLVLERAAAKVSEVDEELSTQLKPDTKFEEYAAMALERLKPILYYYAHHDFDQFLKAYAPPKSSIGRARDASLYLFISAYGWLRHALNAAETHSQDLDPNLAKVAEHFNIAAQLVMTYIEDQMLESTGWPEVGSAIVETSGLLWMVLREDGEGQGA